MLKKVIVLVTIFSLLSLYLPMFSAISYAQDIDNEIINIVKNMPKYYVLDMDIFQNRDINIAEYASKQLEYFIEQKINNPSIDIKVDNLEGGGNFTYMEFSADVSILKNGSICETVHFGWENNSQITMFALITVPSDIEKTEESYVNYAQNLIENNYNWNLPYKIEKNNNLNDKEIVLLNTEKFGTIEYKGEDISSNIFAFISQDEIAIPEPLLIMQSETEEDINTTEIIETVKNMPKYYVLDMDIFQNRDINIAEYASKQLEYYIKQKINNPSIDIRVDNLEGGGNFTYMEFSADVSILKNGSICETVHFGWENNSQITMFALITVPSDIEKTEESYVNYAQNLIENNYNWNLPYKIEKNNNLNDKEIVLLNTEKFGTIEYKGEDISSNIFAFIPQDEIAIPEPIMIYRGV